VFFPVWELTVIGLFVLFFIAGAFLSVRDAIREKTDVRRAFTELLKALWPVPLIPFLMVLIFFLVTSLMGVQLLAKNVGFALTRAGIVWAGVAGAKYIAEKARNKTESIIYLSVGLFFFYGILRMYFQEIDPWYGLPTLIAGYLAGLYVILTTRPQE